MCRCRNLSGAGRAADRARCRRRDRRCARPGGAGREPSAHQDRCRDARWDAPVAERSSVRPSPGIVPKAPPNLTKPLTPNDLAFNFGCVTMAGMRRVAVSAALLIACLSPLHAADDPLARARLLYNQGQFEAAVNAAEQ